MKDIQNLSIKDVAGGAVMAVKVVPGASRDKIVGVLGDALKIATAAAPEKGQANAAVAKIIATVLGVAGRRVTLSSGQTGPRKEFYIAGASAKSVMEKLAAINAD